MILTPDNEYSVILDACVLYPMPLCDTLLQLAIEPAFYRPLWSEQILQEVGNTLEKRKYSREQRERRLRVMREHFPEALVEVPDQIINAVRESIPDQGDCHVLAAAIVGNANAIITQNIKDFPDECLKKYGILCQNADDFLIHQYWLGPDQILEKLDYQAARRKEERIVLITRLGKAVPKFAKLVTTGKFD